MHAHQLHSTFTITSVLAHPTNCGIESFVYVGCTPLKFTPGTPYESNVNSVLTSLVNSASSANFNNFKISLPGSTQNDIVYGLFQCQEDLTTSDCRDCVRNAVSRLGSTCPSSLGGGLQLEGCFVKYDNVSFLGVEDKGVVMQKCGASSGNSVSQDAVLGFLTSQMEYFRVGRSGKVDGVAQCTHDMSLSECQDCLLEATRRLKDACGTSPWGDMFLAKCYARYSERGFSSKTGKRLSHRSCPVAAASAKGHDKKVDEIRFESSDPIFGDPLTLSSYSNQNNMNNGSLSTGDDEVERTLAVTIGIIAGVAVLIVFLSILSKLCERKDGK